ncbi:MAG: hypothetical protein JXB07_03700 [Anaerolineae bacterium]|nr:hypothetical protein [Anaerolineae bacterium]
MRNFIQRQLSTLQVLLDIPFIRRVRRNHGLEHATIHLLAGRVPDLRVVGRSDMNGFWLYGDVPTDVIRQSANMALHRMRAGEHKLAVHPNCGTNLVAVALIGALATLFALIGSEKERFGKLQRLPLLALMLMLAVMVGQPLGLQLQQYVTTLGDPADMEIMEIQQITKGNLTVHRIKTQSS